MSNMMNELKSRFKKCYEIPCPHGYWLHCEDVGQAVLFNHEGTPIRRCGTDKDGCFTQSLEVVSNTPIDNLYDLLIQTKKEIENVRA
jgi:hypothetical protein